MMSPMHLIFPLILHLIFPAAVSAVIQLPGGESFSAESTYCESWRLAVETYNAGTWYGIPKKCQDYVVAYLTGEQYDSDYETAVDYAIDFAKTVKISGDGKDAWIFDVDETLLTNIDYYKAHGYGSEPYNEESFNEWVETGAAPAFDASLRLYSELKKIGFAIIILTGRDEEQRSITEKNLGDAGYSGWSRLILRGPENKGKSATIFKSGERSELIKKGYRIHGSIGDQWTDLLGFPVAERSFKVPNPMYYVP
ncbi:PREDICTED: acid phosphatase 1 [Tarenaya hassleriana]|uniref:acid phosphatase 1 n=1 Tax=Tarenaya hassleriana TaxID=28532 RepID=UPI00053C650E|nr:PREDICTED: acid phosphatase 1 [Tarenaya hassleriana]